MTTYSLDMLIAFVILWEDRHPIRMIVPEHGLIEDRHRHRTKETAADINACEGSKCPGARDEFTDDGDKLHGQAWRWL